MAVLRLDLDIDSDVYPELYAQLAFMSRGPARAERVRQLAATGLVWETVRMHGLPAAQLPTVPVSPVSTVRAPAAAAVAPVAAGPVAQAAAAPARGVARGTAKAQARTASRTPPAEFVDLGISAVPAAEIEAAAKQLPVLLDVVDTAPSALETVAPPAVAPSPAGPPPAAVRADEAPDPRSRRGVTADHVDGGPLEIGSHRAAPRSRLIRMKERGLFKNG